jgi:enolase
MARSSGPPSRQGRRLGRKEALEVRDGGPERFGGVGVLRAIGNITERITPLLIGIDVREQERIEQAMCRLDGTENKSNLGANAILAVSLAVSHAAALSERMPFYAYSAQHSGNKAGFIL